MYNNITIQGMKLFKMWSERVKFRDILNISRLKRPHIRLKLRLRKNLRIGQI